MLKTHDLLVTNLRYRRVSYLRPLPLTEIKIGVSYKDKSGTLMSHFPANMEELNDITVREGLVSHGHFLSNLILIILFVCITRIIIQWNLGLRTMICLKYGFGLRTLI